MSRADERQKVCPGCGKRLNAVMRNTDSWMNKDQFDSVKAGDWYCAYCPSNGRGVGKSCYWWDRELPEVIDYQI